MDHGPTVVTAEDSRPAGNPDECFYCRPARKIGEDHQPDCVVPQRTWVVRYTIDIVRPAPRYWDAGSIEFHQNDGTWCATNLIDDIGDYFVDPHCACNQVTAEVLREADEEDEESLGWRGSVEAARVVAD